MYIQYTINYTFIPLFWALLMAPSRPNKVKFRNFSCSIDILIDKNRQIEVINIQLNDVLSFYTITEPPNKAMRI